MMLLLNNNYPQTFFLETPAEAFTNPFGLYKTSVYDSPYVYMKEISSNTEAGWIISIKGKVDNFFSVDIEELNLKNVWIHKGDIGINIQNYDSIPIPIYSSIDTANSSKQYVFYSYTCAIYDISENYFFVYIPILNIYGWIDRKYLCGSPYTTCN